MDSFLIKKIIASWFMPLPLICIALLFALLLYVFSNNRKTATLLMAIATFSLIALSLQPVSDTLIAPLEWQNTPLNTHGKKLDYIAVLGCGHTSNDRLPATMELHSCSLQRVIESLRLYQKHPQATVIFSGHGGLDKTANATIAAEAAISLGLPTKNTIILNQPKDTQEEAVAVASIVNNASFAVVTSASHMPRALRYFHSVDKYPLAAPTAYRASSEQRKYNYQTLSPGADNLITVRRAWYEWIASVNQKLSK